MTKHTITELIRIGTHEVQVSIAGTRLLPSADVPGWMRGMFRERR